MLNLKLHYEQEHLSFLQITYLIPSINNSMISSFRPLAFVAIRTEALIKSSPHFLSCAQQAWITCFGCSHCLMFSDTFIYHKARHFPVCVSTLLWRAQRETLQECRVAANKLSALSLQYVFTAIQPCMISCCRDRVKRLLINNHLIQHFLMMWLFDLIFCWEL